MNPRFDCIVIGAGPAGLTAALVLARAGTDVVVLERGQHPGSKNLFGGVLYSRALEKVIPDFRKEAPLERPVSRWSIGLLDHHACVSMDFKSTRFLEEPYNAFTVLRAKFDPWFARKVSEAGATILNETVVDDLIRDHDRIVGVRTGRDQGELFADVVVAADGVNSVLKREAGVHQDLKPQDVSLGVKEILSLPQAAINRAFSLSGDEGSAQTFVGSATRGIPGGGFIYTNKSSLSVGVVTKLSALVESKVRPEELLDEFKRHPLIAPLVKEAERREYSAHLIPEGSFENRSSLVADGLLVAGDAAGFTLSTGLRVEGANYAIMSGLAAAEAVKIAGQKKDFSRKGLEVYQTLLKDYGVLSDLKTFRHAPRFFKNPRLYQAYPEMACRLVESLYSVTPEPKKGFFHMVRESMKERVSWPTMIKDIFSGWRGLA